MSKNLAETLVWKYEYDIKLWRHKQRTSNKNDHHIPLNDPPPIKIFCARHCAIHIFHLSIRVHHNHSSFAYNVMEKERQHCFFAVRSLCDAFYCSFSERYRTTWYGALLSIASKIWVTVSRIATWNTKKLFWANEPCLLAAIGVHTLCFSLWRDQPANYLLTNIFHQQRKRR